MAYRRTACIMAVIMIWVMMGCAVSSLNAQDLPKKNVLILHSYYPGMQWTEGVHQGMQRELHRSGRRINIYTEYMEVRRLQTDWDKLRLFYKARYANTVFDVVLCSDNDAFEFLRHFSGELFPGVPVVFCGVNDFQAGWLDGYSLFTGVAETVDLDKTLEAALQLHPETRQVAVFVNNDRTGESNRKLVIDAVVACDKRLVVRFYEQATLEQALAVADELSDNSIILLMNIFHDAPGKAVDIAESTRLLSERSHVPIYSSWDFFLGHGIVGGMMTNAVQQGEAAGKAATRILRGEPVSAIPVLLESPAQYMFDYSVLHRFDINEDALPPGSEVINRPIPFYKANRILVWKIGGVIIVLVLFIIMLLFNVRSRMKAEADLRVLNERLEERVVSRTADLENSNKCLRNQAEELTAVQQELRAQTEELLWTSETLERELEQRNFAETALLKAHNELEIRVRERTMELEEAHRELAAAYDATIEGWAKALELRDIESAGHSRRVAAATMKLADALGVDEQQKVHLRRGAYLHDIGKMSIPDGILFKPGPLSETEWEIMKKHPVYAKNLLASISFLAPAIEVPYCHHEKWDGTGYPQGLKGEEIPLGACIFAIIDVWDALASDRPYRPAWSEEEIREYICSQSGTHFSPRIVEAFLSLQPIDRKCW